MVVTGASRGIGAAIARRAAVAGYRLVLAARDEQRLGAVAADCATKVHCMAADLAAPGAGTALIDAALAACGRIDVLVNNAGIAPMQAVSAATPELLDAVYALNMRLLHETTWRAWPSLARHHGVILNISSLAASDPFPGFQLYGASKAWVNLYTRAIAAEGSASGIRAYALGLGAVSTELLYGLFPDFPPEQTLSTEAVAEFALRLLDPALAPASGETINLRAQV